MPDPRRRADLEHVGMRDAAAGVSLLEVEASRNPMLALVFLPQALHRLDRAFAAGDRRSGQPVGLSNVPMYARMIGPNLVSLPLSSRRPASTINRRISATGIP